MVHLREDDRVYTKYLWFENPVDPNSDLIIFRFSCIIWSEKLSIST